ncbi:MAG: hypothetical protein Q9M45_02165 [Robiginitomaculum sp.]|nr:hypothetical protein [Robiginitomaculum sp.]
MIKPDGVDLTIIFGPNGQDVTLWVDAHQCCQGFPGTGSQETFKTCVIQQSFCLCCAVMPAKTIPDHKVGQAHQGVDAWVHGFEITIENFSALTPYMYFGATTIIRAHHNPKEPAWHILTGEKRLYPHLFQIGLAQAGFA